MNSLPFEMGPIRPVDEADSLLIPDKFFSLSDADQTHFILGRRLGYYRQFSDMGDDLTYGFVEKQVDKIQQTGPDSFEEFFHNLRRQVT